MTPSAWIALGSLAAFLFIQSVVFAFVMGRLFQDVSSLKSAGPERAVQALAIARLEVSMSHFDKKLDEFGEKIDERLGFLQQPPAYSQQQRRRAKPRGPGE